uniref:Uncharacterized protein n=1 Tax=Medicago sativa TaxID=3879 RepID=A0AA96LAL0_MEDSA|nr:hypothetical protein [Medicago sativa]
MKRIHTANRFEKHKPQQKQTTPPQIMKFVTEAQPSPSSSAVLEDGWSNDATFTLIDAWGKLSKTHNRKYLRQYHWKEIAKTINDHHGYSRKERRTYVHCKNRFEALKKKYAIEKARVSENEFYDDEWVFFEKLDSVLGDGLPAKKVSPPVEPTLDVPAWALAPVGRRSGAQSTQNTQKQPAEVRMSSESAEEESRFRRNVSSQKRPASVTATSSPESAGDLQVSNESKKRKRGRRDVELGHREVAGRKDRELGYREVTHAMEKLSEVHERVESSKQRKHVDLEKQKMQKQKMQFSKDSQRVQFSEGSQRMEFLKDSQIRWMQFLEEQTQRIQSSEGSQRMQFSRDSQTQRVQYPEDSQRMQFSKDSQTQRMQFPEDSRTQRMQFPEDSRRMQFSKDSQRMQFSKDSQTPRMQFPEDSQRMQFSKDSQRMQLQKTNNSKHMDDVSAPSRSRLDSQSTKKKVRGPTLMKKLALDRTDGQRIPIEFDQSTGKSIGENKTKFKSYLGFLGRSKISILIEDWDSVDANVKDEIWTEILKIWDVPNSGFLRKKWIAYVGERWRAFKTNLTSRYIHGDLRGQSPLEAYNFLDEETWQAFVQMRLDPAFQEIRKKAQMSSAHHTTPHRLSRGGYELLQEKIMQEKLKQKQDSLGDSVAAPPSPPARHEQWKRARQKPSGDYTSEDSRIIAEKIDSLVEKTAQGTFVPQGRKDILAEAIGKPEHSGFVRGVGRGVGIKQYFGPLSRDSTPPVFSSEQLKTIKVELTQQIKEELMQDLEAMGFSKKPSNFPTHSPNTVVPASTKGSSSVVPPIPEEDEIPERCELYVDDFLHAVAYGNIYKLGPTIHNQILENDMVRVVVSEVLDANAQVPMPTDEVETVGQALNNFIQWPKRLVEIVSDKDVDGYEKDNVSPKRSNPQLDSVQQLVLKAMCMSESIKLELEHDRMKSLWLSQRDIMELCMGKQELSITILRLWLTYLNRLSINVGKSDLYGFIDPCFIQSQHDPSNAEAYIQNKLCDDKKECYLAPYYNNRHWQLLIICPKKNNVVFLCSLERKPDKNIIQTVDSALDGYHKLQGVQKKKPTWIVPVCQRQPESYECGYYIMIHMLKIVSDGIIDSWKKIFGNPEPFDEDELINVRQRCASLILEFIQGTKNV